MFSTIMSIKTALPAVKPEETVNNLLPAEAELSFEVYQSALIAEQQSDQHWPHLAMATSPKTETPCMYSVVDDIHVVVRNSAGHGAP